MGLVILYAYAQQGYVFGHVGLYVYMYLNEVNKNGCLVPYCLKISCQV